MASQGSAAETAFLLVIHIAYQQVLSRRNVSKNSDMSTLDSAVYSCIGAVPARRLRQVKGDYHKRDSMDWLHHASYKRSESGII